LVLAAFLIRRNILHKGMLFFPIFILLAGTIRSLNKLLSYLTGNAIYMVCPTCGYANHKLVDHCGFCANAGLAVVRTDNQYQVSLSLQDEIAEYRKADAYREVSEPILRGLNLPKSEVILIYKQVSPIRRNGSRFLLDGNGFPCSLNTVCLTSNKIYFIAKAFGGWRLINSYPYPNIVVYQTGTRVMSDPMELIDDIDKMIIRTANGDEYLLRGLNPKKLFLSIKSCIRRRQSSYSVDSNVLEHARK